jgi:hypothetical protein
VHFLLKNLHAAQGLELEDDAIPGGGKTVLRSSAGRSRAELALYGPLGPRLLLARSPRTPRHFGPRFHLRGVQMCSAARGRAPLPARASAQTSSAGQRLLTYLVDLPAAGGRLKKCFLIPRIFMDR